ncbi:MAG: type II toxin-antitoxin system Phd/YefM family antitoxin [Gammaproteobacteria bacterium]|nr:type II toxin-antitoxin system Phd/YefM family antitoxin [Gammaproteobacteria bacterium]
MTKNWQVQEAKARFSELVRSADSGPQTITVHGRRAAVVLSADDYDRLKDKRGKRALTEFLRDSPLAGVKLDLERDRSLPRKSRL